VRGGKRAGAGRHPLKNNGLRRRSVGVRLPNYLADFLRDESERQGISQGELIEKAVVRFYGVSMPLPLD